MNIYLNCTSLPQDSELTTLYRGLPIEEVSYSLNCFEQSKSYYGIVKSEWGQLMSPPQKKAMQERKNLSDGL